MLIANADIDVSKFWMLLNLVKQVPDVALFLQVAFKPKELATGSGND